MTRSHATRRIGAMLAASLLTCAAVAGAAVTASAAEPAPQPQVTGVSADLVLFPGPADEKNPLGPSTRYASLEANRDVVEGLKGTFDGITLDTGPTGWNAMKPGYSANVDSEMNNFVTPLVESGILDGFTHNLIRAQVRPEATWTDDAAWSQITENFRVLAEHSVATGSRGILFDIENYVDVKGDGSPWNDGLFNWDEGVDGTLEEAERLARQRGAELMSAVLAVQPDAEMIFTRGASDCTEAPPEVDPYVDTAANELQCPFISGALDVATSPNQVIDGGQLYYLRTAEDFDRAYEWRDAGLLDEPQMDYQSDADRARWTEYLGQSNGVMTKWRQNDDYEMTPAEFEEALYQGLRVDDTLTWAYTTEDDILRPGFPAEWREAIDNAVARAASDATTSEEPDQLADAVADDDSTGKSLRKQ